MSKIAFLELTSFLGGGVVVVDFFLKMPQEANPKRIVIKAKWCSFTPTNVSALCLRFAL